MGVLSNVTAERAKRTMSLTASATIALVQSSIEEWEELAPISQIRKMEALLGDYECVYYARRVDTGSIYYTIVEARRLTEVEIEKFNKVNFILTCSKFVSMLILSALKLSKFV